MSKPTIVQFGRAISMLAESDDPDFKVVATWLFEIAMVAPYDRLECRLNGATVAEVTRAMMKGG